MSIKWVIGGPERVFIRVGKGHLLKPRLSWH